IRSGDAKEHVVPMAGPGATPGAANVTSSQKAYRHVSSCERGRRRRTIFVNEPAHPPALGNPFLQSRLLYTTGLMPACSRSPPRRGLLPMEGDPWPSRTTKPLTAEGLTMLFLTT